MFPLGFPGQTLISLNIKCFSFSFSLFLKDLNLSGSKFAAAFEIFAYILERQQI